MDRVQALDLAQSYLQNGFNTILTSQCSEGVLWAQRQCLENGDATAMLLCCLWQPRMGRS
jgi:hypothetical protein